MLFVRTTRAAKAPPPETRERILDAALSAFAEMGYEGATTREIASHANVPQGLLRYHFGGKLQLWKAAVDRAFDDIHAGLNVSSDTPLDRNDPLAPVRAAIRAHVRYVAQHPEFVRLMHAEGKRRSPRMRWLVDRHVKPMFARLEKLIQYLQKVNRLPADIAPMHFAYSLIGAIDVIFHQSEECRRVTGVDPTDPSVVASHFRAVEYMLLGPPPVEPFS